MNSLTQKQREILEVALNLFHERGFADTSMRDIAEVMNVKAASLYAHIKSKEQIMEWISEDVKSRFMEKYYEINDSKLSKEDKFKLMVRNHLNSIFHNVKLYNVFFINIFRLRVNFKHQFEYLEDINEYIVFAEGIIRDYLISIGMKEGENLELTIKFSMNIFNNMYRYIPEENFDIDKHTEFLRNMLLYGVIGKK